MSRILTNDGVFGRYAYVLAGVFLVFGLVLGLGASVWATSIGNNVAVTGTLTTTGATTLTGAATLSSTLAVTGATTLTGAATLSSTLAVTGATTLTGTLTANGAAVLNGAITLGDAVTDTITWNAGTSTIGTTNNAFQLATSSAPVAFFGLNAATYRVGVGTGTPGAAFSVGGDGTMILGNNSSATTTLIVDASSTIVATSDNRGIGGCINIRNASDGAMYRMFIVTGGTLTQSASTSLRVEVGSCR